MRVCWQIVSSIQFSNQQLACPSALSIRKVDELAHWSALAYILQQRIEYLQIMIRYTVLAAEEEAAKEGRR